MVTSGVGSKTIAHSEMLLGTKVYHLLRSEVVLCYNPLIFIDMKQDQPESCCSSNRSVQFCSAFKGAKLI